MTVVPRAPARRTSPASVMSGGSRSTRSRTIGQTVSSSPVDTSTTPERRRASAEDNPDGPSAAPIPRVQEDQHQQNDTQLKSQECGSRGVQRQRAPPIPGDAVPGQGRASGHSTAATVRRVVFMISTGRVVGSIDDMRAPAVSQGTSSVLRVEDKHDRARRTTHPACCGRIESSLIGRRGVAGAATHAGAVARRVKYVPAL